jgi:hypothetical protein
MQVSLSFAVANVALTVLSADRLTESISGAMCAYGVLDANPYGFTALGLSVSAALACALWLVLHRLDLRLRGLSLTRRKLVALAPITVLLALDLIATLRWVLALDMQVVASCCSVGLDGALGGRAASGGAPYEASALAGFITVGLAALAGFWSWRRPTRAAAWASSVASVLALCAALPAILWYVAPHAYETPNHNCPFCLLHADVYGIGWPLFGALFGAAATGLAPGLVESQRRAANDGDAVSELQSRYGRLAALSWVATLVLSALPVARFAWVSGGASLFGG